METSFVRSFPIQSRRPILAINRQTVSVPPFLIEIVPVLLLSLYAKIMSVVLMPEVSGKSILCA